MIAMINHMITITIDIYDWKIKDFDDVRHY